MQPNNIDEAIEFGLMVGPLSEIKARVKRELKEFMQKVAKDNPNLSSEELINHIFGGAP